MPNNNQHEKAIAKLTSHTEVWNFIQTAADKVWTPGKRFEYGVLRLFEIEKAVVRYPFHLSGTAGGLDSKPGIIEQIDGVLYVGALPVLVESKDYKDTIDVAPIAKLRMRLERRPAGTLGLIFSQKGLTEPAAYILRNTVPKNILVWQGDEIEAAVKLKRMCDGLLAKYRYAVERGLPDFNLQTGSW